jgi:hypothetical protein
MVITATAWKSFQSIRALLVQSLVSHLPYDPRCWAPGQLEVALTTLVFPDGRSIKVNAFMDRNPAHDLLNAPKVRTNSFDFGDYKRGVSSMLGSFTSGIGAVQRIRNRGPEFSLKAGTLVPVRLNSTIDLTLMSPPTVATGAPAAGSPATTSGIGNLSPLNPPQGTFGMLEELAVCPVVDQFCLWICLTRSSLSARFIAIKKTGS